MPGGNLSVGRYVEREKAVKEGSLAVEMLPGDVRARRRLSAIFKKSVPHVPRFWFSNSEP